MAYSYANAVFLASAIETFLLLTYTNSVVLLYNWKRTIPEFLDESLKKKQQSRSLGPITEELRSLSIVNMVQAEQWLGEIYGSDLLERSLGASRYKKFRAKFNDLVSKRNSILHRGGEGKKGAFIEVRFEELNALRKDAEEFGKRVARLILDWWIDQLQKDPTLARAVLGSV